MEGERAGSNERNDRRLQIRQLFRDVDQQELTRQLHQAFMNRNEDRRGLTQFRIREFEHFKADESMVGEECDICMDELEVGTEMIRLDCHIDHYLCEVCAYSWFRHHSTCPKCRHEFEKF